MPHPEIPLEALLKEQELADAEPDVNPWACIILLVFTVGLMGISAEFVRWPISPYSYIASPLTHDDSDQF